MMESFTRIRRAIAMLENQFFFCRKPETSKIKKPERTETALQISTPSPNENTESFIDLCFLHRYAYFFHFFYN